MPDSGVERVFELFRKTARRPKRPATRVIYTGHPPVLEQIAGQVRTATGMTFGKITPDGRTIIPPAFLSPRS
jgi:hypothetical protein